MRDSDWCVPVRHVAKLNRMRGQAKTKTDIKFCADPQEESPDNDTTPGCLGTKLSDMASYECSRAMTFQVVTVKKVLGSVSQMVKNGNKPVFDQDSSGKDMSYIQNKRSNEKTWLRQENGVYILDLMVAPPQMSRDRSADAHFHRQG